LDNLISVQEAAKRLGGISKWTIYSWLSQGRMKRAKVGSRTMLLESELDKVVEHGGKSRAPGHKTRKHSSALHAAKAGGHPKKQQ
jgi:excisionase family DNA binding protein